jgi:hypothetical protein
MRSTWDTIHQTYTALGGGLVVLWLMLSLLDVLARAAWRVLLTPWRRRLR